MTPNVLTDSATEPLEAGKGGEGGVVELTEKLEADVSRRRKDDFLKSLSDLNMISHK